MAARGVLWAGLLGAAACGEPEEVCISLADAVSSPIITLSINGTEDTFLLDTGLLYLLLNPAWKERGLREGEPVAYRMWGRPYRARHAGELALSVSGTGLTAPMSDWALVSQEKTWCFGPELQHGCGGIIGGIALGHVAAEVRQPAPETLCLTEGPCRKWPSLRWPMPTVEVVVEGEEMQLLFDSGAIETRVFHPTRAPRPEINVPGLRDPLLGEETSASELERFFPSRTLNGITFDGVIGWNDIKRLRWTWSPCRGTVEIHGYLSTHTEEAP